MMFYKLKVEQYRPTRVLLLYPPFILRSPFIPCHAESYCLGKLRPVDLCCNLPLPFTNQQDQGGFPHPVLPLIKVIFHQYALPGFNITGIIPGASAAVWPSQESRQGNACCGRLGRPLMDIEYIKTWKLTSEDHAGHL